MKKITCAILTIIGLYGLFMAMNDDANHLNFIGALLFGFSCLIGANVAKDNIHPILWLSERKYIKKIFHFWGV